MSQLDNKISAAAKVRHLLELSPQGQMQAEWADFYAAKIEAAPAISQSVVIFRLGREWLALATNVFQEITEHTAIHSLPHRREGSMLGLVRVRGELLICISLAALLGVESDTQSRTVRHMVVVQNGHRFVFPTDEIFGIHRIIGELQPTPSTVAQAASTYTRGVFSWRDRTVGCLDDQLLFHTLNRSLT